MIAPSRRAVGIGAACALPAFLVALAWPGAWVAGLLPICALLAFLAADAAAGPGRAALAAEVKAPRRVGVGGRFAVRVAARLEGEAPSRIEARLGHDERLAPAGRPGGAISRGEEALSVGFTAKRRGRAVLDRLWLRWRGPFGLAWKQAELPLDRVVSVEPDLGAVREEAIALLKRDTSEGERAERRKGGGREFEALAEYRPGMGRQAIDWKRSARHGKLVAREFRIESNNNIVLAVDCGRLMCEPVDGVAKLDRAVTAALLSAFVALTAGDLVSLFAFDARPRVASGAVRGSNGFASLQARAAEIDYSTEETNFTLAMTSLGARLSQRSLVVVFTDFVDPIGAELMLQSAGRLAGRHLVLFVLMRDGELEALADLAPTTPEDVARAVAAGALLRERELVIARLKRLGAHAVEADHRRLGPALVDRYLEIKGRGLL